MLRINLRIKTMRAQTKEYYESRVAFLNKAFKNLEIQLTDQKTSLANCFTNKMLDYERIGQLLKNINILNESWSVINDEGQETHRQLEYFELSLIHISEPTRRTPIS